MITFPTTPTDGTVHTAGSSRWIYDATRNAWFPLGNINSDTGAALALKANRQGPETHIGKHYFNGSLSAASVTFHNDGELIFESGLTFTYDPGSLLAHQAVLGLPGKANLNGGNQFSGPQGFTSAVPGTPTISILHTSDSYALSIEGGALFWQQITCKSEIFMAQASYLHFSYDDANTSPNGIGFSIGKDLIEGEGVFGGINTASGEAWLAKGLTIGFGVDAASSHFNHGGSVVGLEYPLPWREALEMQTFLQQAENNNVMGGSFDGSGETESMRIRVGEPVLTWTLYEITLPFLPVDGQVFEVYCAGAVNMIRVHRDASGSNYFGLTGLAGETSRFIFIKGVWTKQKFNTFNWNWTGNVIPSNYLTSDPLKANLAGGNTITGTQDINGPLKINGLLGGTFTCSGVASFGSASGSVSIGNQLTFALGISFVYETGAAALHRTALDVALAPNPGVDLAPGGTVGLSGTNTMSTKVAEFGPAGAVGIQISSTADIKIGDVWEICQVGTGVGTMLTTTGAGQTVSLLFPPGGGPKTSGRWSTMFARVRGLGLGTPPSSVSVLVTGGVP